MRRRTFIAIKSRVQELQMEASKTIAITLEGQIAKLEDLLIQAKQLKQISAGVSVIDKQNELMGLKIQRLESKRVDQFAAMSDEELEAYVNRDKALADSAGIEPTEPVRAPVSGNGHDVED